MNDSLLLSQEILRCKQQVHVTALQEGPHGGTGPRANCLPKSMLEGAIQDYDDFREERRQLIALEIKAWFEAL